MPRSVILILFDLATIDRFFLKIASRQIYIGTYLCATLLWNAAVAGSVPEVLREAVHSDARVQSARSQLQARQVEASGARSVYKPTIRSTGSVGSSRTNDPLTRDGSKRVYGLEVEQPIPLFGRESSRVKLADETLRVEEQDVLAVEQAVLAELLELVLEHAARREMLSLREQHAAMAADQAAAGREAMAGGGLKATELALIQSRAVQAQTLLAGAKADFSIADAKLRQRFATAPVPPWAVADFDAWWPVPTTKALLTEQAMLLSASLRKAQGLADLAEAEHTVARADLWPKVSVNVQWQQGSFGTSSADSRSIFLGLSAPLYEGGAGATQAESAAFRAQAARETVLYERRHVEQRVDEAWARWQAAEAMVLAWREAVSAEKEMVDLTAQQLANGAATRIGLLQATQSWTEALLQSAEQRWKRDAAKVKLLLESGLLALRSTQEK